LPSSFVDSHPRRKNKNAPRVGHPQVEWAASHICRRERGRYGAPGSELATSGARGFEATRLESKRKAGKRAWRFWRCSISGGCGAARKAS
jgi:hypothetical protein